MALVRTTSPTRVAAVVLAAAVTLGGCGVDNPMGQRHRAGAGPPAIGAPGSGTPGYGMQGGRWMHGMRGMHGMMAPRDEADYLLTMVPHHREAIVAAESLTRSQHPELRRLGRTIRRTQSQQVRMMERWIARWYPEARPSTDYQPMMSDLSGLRGDALDRTFLVEMVHHHMMAVMMSRYLVRSGLVRHQAVAGLAESVIDDQSAEIVLMRQWLRRWA
jgi:uncharacterized protein (DUF305 family)